MNFWTIIKVEKNFSFIKSLSITLSTGRILPKKRTSSLKKTWQNIAYVVPKLSLGSITYMPVNTR